jgi:hypothetical protein
MNALRRRLLGALPFLTASAAALSAAPADAALLPTGVVSWKRFRPPTSNFTVSSTTYITTNMPVDSRFTKTRPDTYLWMICNLDFTHSTEFSTSLAMVINGKIILSVAMPGAPNNILTCSMSEVDAAALPAGVHHCFISAAVSAGTAILRTPVCSFTVFEMLLPGRQS